VRDASQRDIQRLYDILDAIAAIDRHRRSGQEALFQDEMLLVWMAHHIQIIGEASSRLSPDFRRMHSDQPWPDIVGMRNIIVHDYWGVSAAEIWAAIARDIPRLKDFVVRTVADMESKEGPR
jgi:uncharacterized protein with HEPN domain